jgi:xylulokinase
MDRNKELLAGLDIGTTGCKVAVYRPDGEYLGRVYRDYPHARTAKEHEVEPALVWKGVREVLTEAAAKWPDIKAVGVTSFGETFVLLDERDQPLRNAMLYTDSRGEEECNRLCEMLGREKLARITGINPHPMYSIAKLMWVKKHCPDDYAKTCHICLMEDYIIYLLTGTAQIDYALATRTMAFDIRCLAWSKEVLDAAGIDMNLFSKPVPTGSAAGTLKPLLSDELGLSPHTLFVSAGHDQVAAAVGSGVFEEGAAVDGAGTVECITPVFSGIPESESLIRGSYAIVPHVEKGKFVCYAFSFTGGAAVKWFVDNLAGYAEEKGSIVYRQLEGSEPLNAPTGLLVLPHFAGAATPYMDYGSKAAILGLTLSTTRQELYCAIMEGVCFEMRINMERLKEAGITFHSLRATGGGANSRVWMQMKADVLGVPVTALHSGEAGSAGAAMMAGVEAGIFSDLRSAARIMVVERETFKPRSEMYKKYTEIYHRYEKLYAAVRPLVE